MLKLVTLTQVPVMLPGGIGLTVGLEFDGDKLTGTQMRVARMKKPGPMLSRPSPTHQLVLDILEGRAKLKADAAFGKLVIEGTKLAVSYPIGARMTDHQREVYQRLIKVRAGKTTSYGELALSVGSGARAVGWTMSHNPLPFIIPCHRVLRANGSIGGWSPIGDIWLKEALLAYERGER
jgi:O-6-methylguanine DNA methyltransferase